MATHTCNSCKNQFTINKPGRPPSKCDTCRGRADIESAITAPKLEKSFADEAIILPSIVSLTDAACETTNEAASKELPISGTSLRPAVPPLGSFTFEIMITNMGFAHRGNDENEAKKRFKHYVDASIAGYGQVGHEKVSFFANGNLVEAFDYYRYLNEGAK